ncbi:hypothetical protein F5B18DRAFT_634231 [Nemania serpens]|nr:hypothetical protein F5B18DRAFT_634231 [Nemania serpens]
MKCSILATVSLLGAVSALPGSIPTITAAPELKGNSVDASTKHSSKSCTSTDCWASYAECNGSLTFVYLCYTPPPCGTATSPEPYSCPPPTTYPTARLNSTTPTVFTIYPASETPTAPPAHTGAVTFTTSTISS